MASQIESGINTYVGNFRKLIEVCESFGTSYNPTVNALTIPELQVQLRRIQESINTVDTLLPTYLAAESDRRAKFALLPPLATRVQAAAIAVGLPAAILVRIKEVVRKIRGSRAHSLKPVVDSDTDAPATKHVSVSQTSFNEEIEHFNQLIALVASQPAYAPVETALTVAELNSLLNAMRLANVDTEVAETPLANARIERNRLLYTPQTGMMDTALRVKEYVKSVFGASSPQYKEVARIKFHNLPI